MRIFKVALYVMLTVSFNVTFCDTFYVMFIVTQYPFKASCNEASNLF